MSEPLTEQELQAMEQVLRRGDPATLEGVVNRFGDLIAEVRRLRGLFTEDDAAFVERLATQGVFAAVKKRAADLASRIRTAIGEPHE